MPCDAKWAEVTHEFPEKSATFYVALLGKLQSLEQTNSKEWDTSNPSNPRVRDTVNFKVTVPTDLNTPLSIQGRIQNKGTKVPYQLVVKVDNVIRLVEPHKTGNKPFLIDEVFCQYLRERDETVTFQKVNMIARPQTTSTATRNSRQGCCTIEVEIYHTGRLHIDAKPPRVEPHWLHSQQVVDPSNRSGSRIDFFPVEEISQDDMCANPGKYGGSPGLDGSVPIMRVKFNLITFDQQKDEDETKNKGARTSRNRTHSESAKAEGTEEDPVVFND